MSELINLVSGLSDALISRPLLLLLLITLPFVVAAYFRRAYPHTPLVLLMLVPCVLTFAVIFKRDVLPIILTVDLVLVIVAFIDFWSLPYQKDFEAERNCLRIVSLQKDHKMQMTVTNKRNRKFSIAVRDDLPQEFEATPDEFSHQLSARSRSTFKYDLRASRRGKFALDAVHLRVRSRWGLWRCHVTCPVQTELNVYPDMEQLSKYAILARTNKLSLMGLRRTRRIGQDNEFERLRDFTRDDNYKHIDWRTTARRNKLTVKDFQTSQSQRLIFLVDCGRMMTNESSGISLLDHSLNAMLMLSYVALSKGDSVGMIGFSDTIHSFIPPRGGLNQMNQLLHASFDRFPNLVESRYDMAFLHLSRHCLKRSLVILVTNLIDEVNANQVHRYLSTLVGRHLPLGVMLRDHRLYDAADQLNPRGEELFACAAAAEILTWRHQVLTDLQHMGVLALDVFPEDMTAPLVNKYLEIKARHLL